MEYMSVKEAAERFDVSGRRVHQYCKEGRICGLLRFGCARMIPAAAEKPTEPRRAKRIGGDDNGTR